jgi:membrane protein
MKWMREILKRLRLLWVAIKKFYDDKGFFLSSGITFNLLMGLIPLTLLLLALAGTYLYSDRAVLSHLSQHLKDMLPSVDPGIMNNILAIVENRKIVGFLGIAGLIWTATCVFSSLRTALNIVFQVEVGQGILKGKAIDLFMILLAGTFHVVSMGFTSMATYLHGYHFNFFLKIGPIILFFFEYLIPFFFTFWMFFLIYKIIPNRKILFWTAFRAAFFTSLFWEGAKQFFGWFVLNLGRFSVVYGSLSTLVVFVLWVYYSSAILLLGGEIALLIESEGRDIHA